MHKHLKLGIILLGMIAVLLIILLVLLNVNFLIKEAIRIQLNPTYQQLSLVHGDEANITIAAVLDTPWLCTATCTAQVLDVGSGKMLKNATFTFSNHKEHVTSLQYVVREGQGQDVLSYSVSCTTKHTNLCPTNTPISRKSTITITYDLNNKEKAEQAYAKDVLLNASLQLARNKVSIERTKADLASMDLFTEDLKNTTLLLDRQLHEQELTLQDAIRTWEQLDFSIYTYAQLPIQELEQATLDRASMHNLLILLVQEKIDLAKRAAALGKYTTHNYTTEQRLLNMYTDLLNKRQRINYTTATAELAHVNFTINETAVQDSLLVYIDAFLLEQLSCQDCSIPMTYVEHGMTATGDALLLAQQQFCAYLSTINQSSVNNTLAIDILQSFTTNNTRINDYIQERIAAITAEMLANTSGSSAILVKEELTRCAADEVVQPKELEIIPVQLPQLNLSPSIAAITDPEPSCCAFSHCTACAGSARHPLLLVHGHSFITQNSAFLSTDIFTPFEDRLFADNVYIPFGVFTSNYQVYPAGDLGMNPLPFVFKVTYYLETYKGIGSFVVEESKTSNLDTYAIRIKESIDNILLLTGKDKVDVIAHSMGGLVVRRYAQVFGEDKLGTVILVGTPNRGIIGRIYDYCTLFGAATECEEMQQGSLFLNKLNSEQQNWEVIAGSGCDMQGTDGDGIVTLSSARLSQTTVVQGNCSTTALLHNLLLNPTAYPGVYEQIMTRLR
ncbi:MAG: alpha/beta fold hydrolase [archaeon]